MKVIMARVGEHTFEIYSESTGLLNFFSKGFLMDFRQPVDLVLELHSGYGVPFVNFDVEIIRDEKKVTYLRADYLIEVDTNFKHATVSVYDDLALKHALMNLYSVFMLHHNWGLLIHSSCAIENGKAHIFSGQSGAGKSTAAKLSAPRELLSDEASIVKMTSDKIIVFNSPFRSEIEPTSIIDSKPLASIQLLNQALQNKRVRLKKSDALIRLMDKVFYWVHDPEETAKIFGLLEKLVEHVPVYDLYFQKNNRFWELIS